MPVLAVTPKYFNSVYSLYHKRIMAFDAAAKLLVSVQHYSFYPIMALRVLTSTRSLSSCCARLRRSNPRDAPWSSG